MVAFNTVNDYLDAIFGLTVFIENDNFLRATYSYEELRAPIAMLRTASNCLDACLDETNRYLFFMKLLNAERLVCDVEKIYHDTYGLILSRNTDV
ncbi:unnamed protein product [Caenorhabditis bovis]|uniref:Uncharacterized protein n=1 Tax=Caenorhabditis bovis TaxID=2654633 RepID=A0A8S1FFB1_9PELO|nr:unnamed protein product [Caenorhabditis bovis]